MIRRATVTDITACGKIINDCAEYGLMLHRSPDYLCEHTRDFHVAVEKDQVQGVCGLNIIWTNIAEIYALAVGPKYRGRGLGQQLVEACVAEARALNIRRLMALTYKKDFFARLGFECCDRQELPLKVWSDCVRCSKNQACDEIAMVRVLEDVPQPMDRNDLRPQMPSDDSYVVPVVLKVGQPTRRQKMDEPQ